MNNAVLCADIGTSSLKAAYISLKGDVLALARIKLEKANESNRWLFALKEAVSLLNQKSKNQFKIGKDFPVIKAICISGNGPSLANKVGSFLWNESLQNLNLENLPKEAIGSIFAPRLFFIKEQMPNLLNHDEWLFSVPEYLVYQLTDKAFTLLPNQRFEKAYWNDGLLSTMGISNKVLPPFIQLGEPFGALTENARHFLGLSKNHDLPPVFCGGPDFSIALIGTNTLSEGKICDRAGTSEGINLCTNMPLISPNLRTLPSPLTPFWNASVIIPDTGSRFAEWKESSKYRDLSYEECVETLIQDKKSEGYNLMLKIALEVKKAYDTIKKVATENDIQLDNKICCTGGQAKNQSWLKLKSEIVGVPFFVGKCADAELMGNAAVACYGLGLYPSIKDAAENLNKS